MQTPPNSSASSSQAGSSGEGQSFFVETPQISLPKGGGALKGIDEKFQVNPVNGTASVSLPLPFSPGRNGFMPAISLGYNSGTGNGIFGLGWDLGFPSIQRRTDKLLPRYLAGEQEDVFLLSGAEDLVPVLVEKQGDWERDKRQDGDYTIRRYRPRIEGGFARIEQISHPQNGMWWKVTSRDNMVTFYGKTPEYRIADPADPGRVFQWLPELSFDDKGNCVFYEFKAEDGVGYGSDLQDANRFEENGTTPRFTNRYLKRVFYSPETPFTPVGLYETANPAPGGFLMELVLDYGEHGSLPTGIEGDTAVSYDASQPWPTRHDAFSSYRSGFEIRTARLCQRVLMFHHFEELGDTPCLVSSLDLAYRDWQAQPGPGEGKKLEVTYLVSGAIRKYIRTPGTSTSYSYRTLPPLEFTYQELQWNTEVSAVSKEDAANAPAGLTSGYFFTDLYNEGISGIFTEQGEGWFYKENLGYGKFTLGHPVLLKPAMTGIAAGVLQLQDLEADGRKQIVVSSPGLNGYFELKDDRTWEPFRTFEQVANVDLRNPNVRIFDINGDSQAEIVLTEEQAFVWYRAEGIAGYGPAERSFKPFDETQGPAIVFSDPEQRIFLADMSGDGLTDIVRIRNGEVCYWPNLGYGRFGRKVTMADSPWFDAQDLFNPAYLQLADISGTGATDLIYLGQGRFRAWLNLSGNAWSEPCEITPFFDTTLPSQITVTDFLGNGTACLVWSSPLPEYAETPIRYIDLMGGKNPHILTSYKNNFGQKTSWEYKSSTHFYLEDKKAGKPWVTRLPFPVQVVNRVTVKDKWRRTTFSTRYSYHHGYFDHAEREFRGFGRVEQTDAEDFGEFAAGNSASPYITDDKTLYQPPVKTITWFHTGAFLSRERILNQFEQEYFRPNGGSFKENELPEPDLEAGDLSAIEYREALRACKGMTLRTETYELDVDALSGGEHLPVKLFSAAFHNCHIQRLQPQGPNPNAVFLVTESEAITYHYELELKDGLPKDPAAADPRIAHSLILKTDELGNALQTLAVAYPRWQDVALNDPSLPQGAEALIRSVQKEMHLVYTENELTNDVRTPQDYRLRMPCEVRTYELTGLTPADGRYFTLAELRTAQPGSFTEIPYQQLPALVTPQKRLVERVRMLYFDENLTSALPFGQLNRLGLPYETYKIALTEGLLQAVLDDKLPTLENPGESRSAMLNRVLPLGGYHNMDGAWWIRSGIAGFADDADEHFYLPERYTDPFGKVTTLTLDPYDLFMERSKDPLSNEVVVLRFDYRVLAPLAMKDPNGNLSEVEYDILGIPARMALKGKGAEADSLAVAPAALTHAEVAAFFTGPYDAAKARSLLGEATACHVYFFGESLDATGQITYGVHPACAASILREKHVAQLAPGAVSPLQLSFEYSDGSGAVIATKVQAEPEVAGGPLRWITNGRTVLNNKGNPVKQYEPYFTPLHSFEGDPDEAGVTATIFYDAAGRTIRTEMPDGTFSRVEFSPWFFRAWDANDTVLEPGNAWYARRTDPTHPEFAQFGTPENDRAAQMAAIHANTPAETHTDSLGREVVAIVHNKQVGLEEKYLTYTKLDAEGKPLWLRDARRNYVMVYARVQDPADFQNMATASAYVPAYDIAGNLLFQHSNEAGNRWMLPDSTGQPMYVWDENEYAGALEQRLMRTEYDALRRPTHQWLRIGTETEKEISRITYGESRPNPEASNLRGQVVISLGPEGRTEAVKFDFKGNLLESRRQLLDKADVHTMDWNGYVEGIPSGHLSPEVFVQRTEYDALSRMTLLHNWHREALPGQPVPPPPAIYIPQYNQRGVLVSETLSVRGSVQDAIRRIEYNAKGQRTLLRLGNDTNTHYKYDPNTFRLTRLFTSSGPGLLQDLHYTYDPVGNITQIEDKAQDTIFFQNSQVKPVQAYEYDALYRLITARGRENATNTDPAPGAYPFGPLDTVIPGSSALRIYTQHYTYDPAGNFTEMSHIANGSSSWTRTYETDPKSNRLLSTQVGTAPGAKVEYQYDTHGSMLNLNRTPDEYRLRWDYRDMIHTLDLGGGGRAYYQYDAGKQRTRKRIERLGPNGNVTRVEERIYLGGMELYRRWNANDLNNPVEEIETHHLFADEQRVLIVEDVVRTDNNDLRTGVLYRYQYSNHLGSAALELNADAYIISYEEYHPYGTTAYQAQNAAIRAAAKRYRYTGMERDEESGLAYHTARYYLPWLGRWGSADPIGVEGGINLFAYSMLRPLLVKDTNGQNPNETVVLGRYDMTINGKKYPKTEMLRNMGKLLPDLAEDFAKLSDEFGGGKEGVSAASNFLVEKILRGKLGVGRIIFDLDGITPEMLSGKGKLLQGATTSELGVVLRYINQGPVSTTDIEFIHAGGTSIIKKGTQIVEGAPLPQMLLDKLSNPVFRHIPPTSTSKVGSDGEGSKSGTAPKNQPAKPNKGGTPRTKVLRVGTKALKVLGPAAAAVGTALAVDAIKNSSQENLPIVVAGEAGSMAGGSLGATAGAFAATAVLTAVMASPPGWAVTTVAIIGGTLGGVLGSSAGRQAAENAMSGPIRVVKDADSGIRRMYGLPWF
ncbi:MAG: SpvB/TcaC N-terminal domain-containing protein [Bacteroidia bacterium]|nr:SpvB/TcaC N-terminal domain-containing protein [Bacteroidia bacterium]